MKHFKNILLFVAVCAIGPLNARSVSKTAASPAIQQEEIPQPYFAEATKGRPTPAPTPTKAVPVIKPQQVPQPKPTVQPKQIAQPTAQPVRKARPARQTKPTKPTTPTPIKQPSPQTKPVAPTKPSPQPKQQPYFAEAPKGRPVKQRTPIAQRFTTNNIIMTLDPHKEETVEKGGGAMVQQVLVALYQKASPIIMTNNILEIIIKAKQQIGDQELQKLRTMGFQQMFNQAQLLGQKSGVRGMNALLVFLLGSVDLDAKNFNCYFHTSDNLILIIPKQYITANAPQAANLSLNEQAKICRFDTAVLTAVTDLSANSLLQNIQKQKAKPAAADKFIPNLTAMFTVQKKNGELIHPEQTSKWIIYISGHGGPAHMTIGVVRKQLAMIKQSIANAKQMLARDKNNPQAKNYVLEYEPRAQEYEKMVEGRSEWQDSQLVPESSQIAGIKATEFAQLMTFFDKSIDTAYVHYVTCFAGGSNQTFVNETLSSLEVHFVVSTQGIHEGYTSVGLGVSTQSNKPGIQVTGQDFTEFFRLLRMFFTQQEEFVKIKKEGEDPILMIIRTIYSDPKPQNQPFVRFPGAGFFAATSVSKSTKILTKTIVRAHEIEKKPIDVKSADIDVLIVNAPRIGVPLNMGKETASGHTAIAFPSPQNFAPAYEAIHTFKEINFEGTLQSFLYHCTYLNARMYPQTLVVNTLKGIAYQQSGLPAQQGTINNLIIRMKNVPGTNPGILNQPAMQIMPLTSQDVKIGTIGENVQVYFEFNKNIYQCMFAIKNVEDPKGLYAYMQKLTFSAQSAQPTTITTIANNLLTPQEITKLSKPITLESIVEYFDDKIDQQDPSMAIQSEADDAALLKYVKQHTK